MVYIEEAIIAFKVKKENEKKKKKKKCDKLIFILHE
jgi:hypothetical protein